jgi:predicted phage tail protein
MNYSFSQVRKAALAAAGAFLSALGTAVFNNGGSFTWPIVLSAIGAGLIVGWGTFQVRNTPPQP